MNHQLNLSELQDFLLTTKVEFATTTTKKMVILLNGSIQVWIQTETAWDLNWQGIQPFSAIEKYNSLP